MVDNLCPSCELFNRITPGTTRVEYDHPDHSLIRGNVLEKELHVDGTFSEVKIECPTDIGYMVALCNPAWLRILGRFDEDDDEDGDDSPPNDGNNNNGDVDEGGGKSNYSGQSGGEAEGDDNVDEGGNGSDNEGGNGSENEDGSIGGASEGGEDASESTISFCMWV